MDFLNFSFSEFFEKLKKIIKRCYSLLLMQTLSLDGECKAVSEYPMTRVCDFILQCTNYTCTSDGGLWADFKNSIR